MEFSGLAACWAAAAAAVALGATGCTQPTGALASSGASSAAASTPSALAAAPSPAGPGRYTIVHSPQVENDTILLDTATGQTWRQVEIADVKSNPVVWVPEPQMNGPADWAALAAEHGTKAKTAANDSLQSILESSSAPPG